MLQIVWHKKHCAQVRSAMSCNGYDYKVVKSEQGQYGELRIEPSFPDRPRIQWLDSKIIKYSRLKLEKEHYR